MTVLEIALPQLKRDPVLVAEALETLLPPFMVTLEEGSVINGLRGSFVTENDVDVTSQYRQTLLLEWPSVEHFQKFITSQPFLDFGGKLKAYVDGPPNLKLIDVEGDVSHLFGSETVFEYIAIKPKDASEAGVKKILQQLQAGRSHFGTSKMAFGASSNLETQEIAVVILYGSDSELDAAKELPARKQLLEEIKTSAEVTRLVAQVKKEIPAAGK
ncbi:hypothetical protein F5Y10DRAFT_116586 [Nemania abortiva]|nr:hypothetical protein F5Y10DRAFT_116586 [Nemania abortiva]